MRAYSTQKSSRGCHSSQEEAQNVPRVPSHKSPHMTLRLFWWGLPIMLVGLIMFYVAFLSLDANPWWGLIMLSGWLVTMAGLMLICAAAWVKIEGE